MALNVTTAVIGSGCNIATASPSLAQWDQGQVLKIEGVELPETYKVEFSNGQTLSAIPAIGTSEGVEIPDEMLYSSSPITAYIVLTDAESRNTEYWVTIYVTPRQIPEGVEPDPEQSDVIDQLIAQLNSGVERAEAAAEMLENVDATATTLQPGSPATAEYSDGVFAFGIPKGEKGDPFTYEDFTEEEKAELVQGPILDAQTAAVAAVGTARDNAVNDVNSAGAAQVQAVQEKGTEVIGSIPPDYSDLTAEVSDLNNALNEVTEIGTNLMPVGTFTTTLANVDVRIENGLMTRTGTASDSTSFIDGKLFQIELEAGTYTFSSSESGFNALALNDGTSIISVINNANSGTFTLQSNTVLWLSLLLNSGGIYNHTNHIMLQKGSTKTAWEESIISAIDLTARDSAEESKELLTDAFVYKYIPFVLGNLGNGSQVTNRMSLSEKVTLTSGTALSAKGTYLFAVYGGNNLLTSGFVTSYTMQVTELCRIVVKKSDDSDLSNVYNVVTIADCITTSDMSVFWLKNKLILSPNIIYGKTNYKKYCSVGDSITYGYWYNGTDMVKTDRTYARLIFENMNIDLYVDNSVPSTAISTTADYSSSTNAFVNRITAIPEDSDIITILGGTNDFGHNTPLGTIADKTDVSFFGALYVLLSGVINRCPSARIIFITPLHRYDDSTPNQVGKTLIDYVNAIKDECALFGVQIIDGYSESGFNNLDVIKTNYMPDGLHPNPDGHAILARNIIHCF